MKLISVVVPVYNAEKTLERCVNSLLCQTYENIEIILVNDGSADNSLEICKKFELSSEKIRVIDKDNSGVSDTRNVGISESRGEYIQFVDSDDYISPGMCRKLVGALEENDCDLAICAIEIRRGGSVKTEILEAGVFQGEEVKGKLVDIYKTNYINSPCNKLYKKDLISEGFMKNISLGEDLLFNLKYLKNCQRIICVSEALYTYDFTNENSLTQKIRPDAFEIATVLYRAVRKFAEGLDEERLKPVRETYIRSFFYAVQDLFYYGKQDSKEKASVLKEWLYNADLAEALNGSFCLPSQMEIVCRMARRKRVFGIRCFFAIKKIIAVIVKK